MRLRCIGGFVLCALVGSGAASPGDVGAHCGGRYEDAATMVDAALGKYGTLYSGGHHRHALDDVGATLDLYRLWQGLPDLALRELGSDTDVDRWDGSYESHLVPEAAFGSQLRRDLAQVAMPTPHFKDRTDAWSTVVRLDLATSTGSPVDWWLAESGVLPSDAPKRQIVRRLASQDELMDWLQHSVAASDAPWAVGWHLSRPDHRTVDEYASLRRLAWDRYRAGDGLEWAVVATLFRRDMQGEADGELFKVTDTLASKAARCGATPAEYAAVAVMLHSNPDLLRPTRVHRGPEQWLPRRLLELIFEREVMAQSAGVHVPMLSQPSSSTWHATHSGRARGLGLGVDAEIWAASFDTYLAPSPDAVFDIHDGLAWSPQSTRAINMMSARDLARFGDAQGVSVERRRALHMAAFARSFALGEIDAASAQWTSLTELLPEAAEDLAAIRRLRVPEDVRQALAILAVPGWSTYLSPETSTRSPDIALGLWHARMRRDLAPDLARGWAVQDDFETLLKLPKHWARYRGMRSYSDAQIGRIAHSKTRRTPSNPVVPSLLRVSAHHRGIGDWAAWQELERLSGPDRLSLRLARVMLDCAERPRRPWFRRSGCADARVAGGLQTLIRIAQREKTPDIDGVPMGKRAFDALHRHFPDAARETRFWYQ